MRTSPSTGQPQMEEEEDDDNRSMRTSRTSRIRLTTNQSEGRRPSSAARCAKTPRWRRMHPRTALRRRAPPSRVAKARSPRVTAKHRLARLDPLLHGRPHSPHPPLHRRPPTQRLRLHLLHHRRSANAPYRRHHSLSCWLVVLQPTQLRFRFRRRGLPRQRHRAWKEPHFPRRAPLLRPPPLSPGCPARRNRPLRLLRTRAPTDSTSPKASIGRRSAASARQEHRILSPDPRAGEPRTSSLSVPRCRSPRPWRHRCRRLRRNRRHLRGRAPCHPVSTPASSASMPPATQAATARSALRSPTVQQGPTWRSRLPRPPRWSASTAPRVSTCAHRSRATSVASTRNAAARTAPTFGERGEPTRRVVHSKETSAVVVRPRDRVRCLTRMQEGGPSNRNKVHRAQQRNPLRAPRQPRTHSSPTLPTFLSRSPRKILHTSPEPSSHHRRPP